MTRFVISLLLWLFLLILVLLGWMYLVIWRLGIASFRSILISFGASKRRELDISELQSIPPDGLQPNIAALENLGFHRLGETQIKLPTFLSPFRSWIFISSDDLTHAIVTDASFKMAHFSTVYSDHASLETVFPMGERINTPNFRSHTVTTDIEKAYQHHIQQITDFEKLHPHPRIIKSMEDYLEWDSVFRKKHIRRKFLRKDLANLMQFISLVYSIAITFMILFNHVRLVVSTPTYLSNPLIIFSISIFLFLVILPAYLLTSRTLVSMVSISQRASEPA